MGIQIFVNLDARSLSTARSRGVRDTRNTDFKQFVVGDSEVLDVFLVSGQSRYQPDAHNIQDYTVRLGLGTLNGKPSEGTFDLGSQTGLAHDIDDAGLDAAITAEVAACAVTKLSNFVFKVVFDATGAQSIPTVDASNLGPSSTASITRVITGDGSTNEEWVIRFFNNPVTLINDWESIDLNSDGGKTFTDPLKGYRGSLNLGTSGVYDLMGDASSAVTTLEIEITDASGRIQTVMQMPVQLSGEVIGQGANGTVEWGAYLTTAKLAESVTAALAAAGVEDGATADQTGAEIKTAYELEADTNAFTDTELAKLAGIEDGATADQSGAEIKTAYELEADTNAFTDAEKATLTSVEDGATGDQTGAEIKTAYESEADTNAFTDTEQAKLAGIEDSATADQSGSEIKTAYELEADTNAFTDTEKATLASIEDGATADQTGAEIKTAYELEADTNAFTDAEKATLASVISPEAILNPLVEGQGLLNSFRGSAAAYSLRDLNKTNPDVVEVRRGSDETSRVFKANEIGGTLENWVNAEVALPLDTASGAAAAYSLRDLSVSRADLTSSGDTQTDSFVLTGATGSSVIFNGALFYKSGTLNSHGVFKLSTDVNVFFYWDSGSYKLWDNNTGAKFSYATALDDTTYPWEADWTGTELSAATLDRNTTGALVAQVRRSSDDEIKSFTAAEVAGSAMVDWVNAVPLIAAQSDFSSTVSPYNFYTSGGSSAYNTTIGGQSGALRLDVGSSAGEHLRYLGTLGGTLFPDIPIKLSVDVYAPSSNTTTNGVQFAPPSFTLTSGQLDNVVAVDTWTTVIIEGTSTDLSAVNSWRLNFLNPTEDDKLYFKNYTITQAAASGHVTKWYDQSGNDNHAVQATPASQPKVVEGGTLVTYNGQTCISNHAANSGIFLQSAATLKSLTIDIFATFGADSSEAIGMFVSALGEGSNYIGSPTNGSASSALAEEATALFRKNGADFTGSTRDDLHTAYHSGAFSLLNINGTTTSHSGWDADTLMFSYRDGLTFSAKCYYSEIIIYDSDQSGNRKAIESNMADYHGNIDLPAGFDSGNNEVDGYVATWYDQSGNGNNAVQAVATSQPKVVEGGVLVADGLKFDEGQSLGVTGNPVITSDYTGTFSGFSVQKLANDNGYVYSNNSSSNGWAVRTEGAILRLLNKFSGGDTISQSVNTTQLVSFVYNNGTSGLLVNGQGTEAAGSYDFTTSTNDFTIGSRYGGSVETHFLDGTISEIIIYDSDQSAFRKNIEFNINNAYSIY